jgi:hypothetical protein
MINEKCNQIIKLRAAGEDFLAKTLAKAGVNGEQSSR